MGIFDKSNYMYIVNTGIIEQGGHGWLWG